MQSAVIIAAIALAVFLGYKTKINTGFFCIVFAYFIGCFWLDLKPKALIAFWPTNTMFVIISVSLFYNVAAANGTLEKILPAVDKCTAPGGIVLCESETGIVLPAEAGGLTLRKQYKYGRVLLWKYTKPMQPAGDEQKGEAL